MSNEEKINEHVLNIFAVTREMDEDFRAFAEVDGALSKMRTALATAIQHNMTAPRYRQLWRQLDQLAMSVGNVKRILTDMGHFPEPEVIEKVEIEVE